MIVTLLQEKVGDHDVPALENELRALGPACGWRMAMDMSEVQLLGSSGLAFLIWVRKQCAGGGAPGAVPALPPGKAVFYGFSDEIMGMLKVTRLTGMLEIVGGKKEAVGAIGQSV